MDGLFVFLTFISDGVMNNRAFISSIWRADANLDGAVNQADLAILAASLRCGGADLRADFNQDGKVDGKDWAVLNEEWGAVGTPAKAPRAGHAPKLAPVKQ